MEKAALIQKMKEQYLLKDLLLKEEKRTSIPPDPRNIGLLHQDLREYLSELLVLISQEIDPEEDTGPEGESLAGFAGFAIESVEGCPDHCVNVVSSGRGDDWYYASINLDTKIMDLESTDGGPELDWLTVGLSGLFTLTGW